MALTAYLLDWYKKNGPGTVGGYFDWLKKPRGISTVMNLQTRYLGYEEQGHGQPLKNDHGQLEKILCALRRKSEDAIYRELNFHPVHSPMLPSIFNAANFSGELTDMRNQQSPVYKAVYMSDGSWNHAVGAILDPANYYYCYFDPNHGLVDYHDISALRNWLHDLAPSYALNRALWFSFFADTKQ